MNGWHYICHQWQCYPSKIWYMNIQPFCYMLQSCCWAQIEINGSVEINIRAIINIYSSPPSVIAYYTKLLLDGRINLMWNTQTIEQSTRYNIILFTIIHLYLIIPYRKVKWNEVQLYFPCAIFLQPKFKKSRHFLKCNLILSSQFQFHCSKNIWGRNIII